MEDSYYSNKGKYQKAYDILWDELVPKIGRANTEMGELLRRLARVYYRYYNDGDTYYQMCDDEYDDPMMEYFNDQAGVPEEQAKKVHDILSSCWGTYESCLESAVDYVLREIMLSKSSDEKIYNPQTGRLVGITTPTGLKALTLLGCKISYSRN